jgi:hypothetical protein
MTVMLESKIELTRQAIDNYKAVRPSQYASDQSTWSAPYWFAFISF